MAKQEKKTHRRMKKQVRKTLGALGMASAIAIAAIPTGSLSGGVAQADTVQSKIFVDATDCNIPIVNSDATIYTTGDGWFQFAYVSQSGSQNDAGSKTAVILGYSHTGSLPGSVLSVPNTVDAYLQYNDNNGTGSGYCAVGKSGNYLFYEYTYEEEYEKLEEYTDYEEQPWDEDGDGNPDFNEDGTPKTHLVPVKKTRVITKTRTVTEYRPCYYETLSNWQNLSSEDFYYYTTADYRPADGSKPVRTTNQAYQRIAGAEVEYIGNQYLKTSGSGWTIAGMITDSSKGIFANNGNIATLEVGSYLSGIGNYAFYGCTAMRSITLENGLDTIGNHAFDYCLNMNTVNVPMECNLRVIGAYAFKDCRGLNSFTIPLNVQSVGDGAFQGCANMSSIELCGNGANVLLSEMGYYVFQDCESLTDLTFPKTYYESVELSSFKGCKSLNWISTSNTTINFVESTGSTGSCQAYTWDDFKGLVTEKFYVEGVNQSAVHKTCTDNEVSFKFLGEDLYELTKEENGTPDAGSGKTYPTVTYQVDSTNTLLGCDFNGTVTSLDFPKYIGPYHISALGNESFKDHCTLEEIHISETIESIGARAFEGCHNLEYVYFNTQTVQIGEEAFQTQDVLIHDAHCTNSASMTKSDNYPETELCFVGAIDENSTPYRYAMDFNGRYSNTSQAVSYITYYSGWPTNLTVKYNYNGSTGKGYSELVEFPTLATLADYSVRPYMKDYVEAASDALANYKNPDKMLTEDQQTFINTAFSLIVPTGVEAIKDGLFYTLTEGHDTKMDVVLEGITEIETGYTGAGTNVDEGKSDFAGCTKLKSLTFKGNEKTISDDAFKGCSGMESVTSYSAISAIGKRAFADDTALETVALYDSCPSIGEQAFSGDTSLVTVAMNGSLGTIDHYAFENCENLTNVSLNPDLNTFGIRPFKGCKVLETVDFQNSDHFTCDNSLIFATSGGSKNTLVECLEGRKNRYIGSNELTGVSTVYQEAFAETPVKRVDMSEATYATLPTNCFKNAKNLTDVILPYTCIRIENYAFEGSTLDYLEGSQYLQFIAMAGMDGIVTADGGQTGITDTSHNYNVTISAPEGSYLNEYAITYDYTIATVPRVNHYTVQFWDWDASKGKNVLVSTQSVEEGADAEAPTPNGREGYVFDKWDPDYKQVTEDRTCFAMYVTPPEGYEKCKVIFYDWDDYVLKTEYVEYGADASKIAPIPSIVRGADRDGYQFVGWDRDLKDTKRELLEVKAVYSEIPEGQFVVEYYNYDGSELYKSVKYLEGSNGNISDYPAREGYTFTGWDRESDLLNIKENIKTRALYTKTEEKKPDTGDDNGGGSGGGTGGGTGGNTGGNTGGGTGGSTGGTGTTTTTYHTLTVVNGSGSGSYVEGAQVFVVANTPASGLAFGSWSITPATAKIATTSISATMVTMPAEDVTVTANFVTAKTSTTTGGSSSSTSGNTTPTSNKKGSASTVVIDKNGLSNTGVVAATVNGSSDNFTVKVSESSAAAEAALKALINAYGSVSSIVYFPMDISLYDSTGTTKITDTTGLTVTITLPLPDSMKGYGGNNKVAAISNDSLEALSAKFTTISGVPCVTFTASHFSPYVIYTDTANLTAAAGIDSSPKTGDGIHPKWFLAIGLFAASLVLFLKRDRRRVRVSA